MVAFSYLVLLEYPLFQGIKKKHILNSFIGQYWICKNLMNLWKQKIKLK